jgi:hypothetical protein
MAAVMPIQTLLIKGYLAGEEAEAAGASRPPSESPRSEVPRLDIAAGGDSKDTELLPLFRHAAAIAYTYWLAQADGFAMRALDEFACGSGQCYTVPMSHTSCTFRCWNIW